MYLPQGNNVVAFCAYSCCGCQKRFPSNQVSVCACFCAHAWVSLCVWHWQPSCVEPREAAAGGSETEVDITFLTSDFGVVQHPGALLKCVKVLSMLLTHTRAHTLTLGLLRFLRPDSVVHSSSLSQGMTLTDQSHPFLPPKFHILQVSSWIFIYPEARRFSFGEPFPAPNPLIEVISWVWNAEAASEQDDELYVNEVCWRREKEKCCVMLPRGNEPQYSLIK